MYTGEHMTFTNLISLAGMEKSYSKQVNARLIILPVSISDGGSHYSFVCLFSMQRETFDSWKMSQESVKNLDKVVSKGSGRIQAAICTNIMVVMRHPELPAITLTLLCSLASMLWGFPFGPVLDLDVIPRTTVPFNGKIIFRNK